MVRQDGTAVARHRLIERRKELDLTQAQVAERIRADTATYARYERGLTAPRVGQRARLAKALEWSQAELTLALNDDDPRRVTRRSFVEWLTLYAALEQGAARLWAFQPITIHALLQTREYATAVEHQGIDTSETQIARLVDLRLTRQSALTREPDPLDFTVIMDESVLRRVTGGSTIMAAQLAHIVAVSGHPNVHLQMLPLNPGVHAAAFGTFTMLASPGADRPQMVCVEDRTGHRYLESPAAIEMHHTLFEHLQSLALSEAESLALIETVKEKYT